MINRYLLSSLILLLGFGLRLYRIDSQSIWWDEGHSIFVASQPLLRIPTLPAMDVHPPAYFSLLHLWLGLTGRSEFSLRYLSALFSLLTVALLWRFAGQLSPPSARTAPALAALLGAISPLYIAYAQEIRSYAMITALALASTFVLWRLLLIDERHAPSKKRGRLLLAYVGLTALCLYTHYFTIFLLLFQNLLWLIWLLPGKFSLVSRQTTPIRQAGLWLASQLGILFLFIPQLRLALGQVTSYSNPNLQPPSLLHFISHSWQAYTVGLSLDPTLARWGMALIAAIGALAWLLQLFRYRSSKRLFDLALLTLWLLLPLAAYFIVLQRRPSFEPRYAMLVTPPLFLLLALALTPPTSRTPFSRFRFYAPHLTFHALTLLTITIFLIALHSYYIDSNYFKDDSAGVARWLAQESGPNDIIYVDVPHPFHYYVERAGISAPIRYLFVDIHTAADILNQEAAAKDRLFWVTWRGSDTDPRGVIPFLAEKAGLLAGSRDFKGYRVLWFDLHPAGQNPFSLPADLTPLTATFGDVLRLDGMAFGAEVRPPEPIWATLHFSLLRQTDTNYKASLRLRSEAGQLVAQIDRDLLNDRHFRTAAWPLTDPVLNQATNVYLLPLPPDIRPGIYQLELIIYDAAPPYPSEGVTGHDTPDGVAATLGRIAVKP